MRNSTWMFCFFFADMIIIGWAILILHDWVGIETVHKSSSTDSGWAVRCSRGWQVKTMGAGVWTVTDICVSEKDAGFCDIIQGEKKATVVHCIYDPFQSLFCLPQDSACITLWCSMPEGFLSSKGKRPPAAFCSGCFISALSGSV